MEEEEEEDSANKMDDEVSGCTDGDVVSDVVCVNI